jgi:hypothetical protein
VWATSIGPHARRRRGELVAVDEAHTGLDGVDPQCRVREVEERHRRAARRRDVRPRQEVSDAALEDER